MAIVNQMIVSWASKERACGWILWNHTHQIPFDGVDLLNFSVTRNIEKQRNPSKFVWIDVEPIHYFTYNQQILKNKEIIPNFL